jgi:hypothetical protein
MKSLETKKWLRLLPFASQNCLLKENNPTVLPYSISLKSLWFGKNAHATMIAIISSNE